jgi:hypothetical protein
MNLLMAKNYFNNLGKQMKLMQEFFQFLLK